MGDGASVLVTLRLSARDRALLEGLVERERQELEELGVEVPSSSKVLSPQHSTPLPAVSAQAKTFPTDTLVTPLVRPVT
jgi:hypothetical protein